MPQERLAQQFVRQSTLALVWVAILGTMLLVIYYTTSNVIPEIWDGIAALSVLLLTTWAMVDRRRGVQRLAAMRRRWQIGVLGAVSISFGNAAAYRVYHGDTVADLLVMAFLLVALLGPVVDIAYSRAAIVVWVIPLVVPTTILILLLGTPLHLMIAIVLLTATLFAVWRGREANSEAVKLVRYRMENERMVAQLREHMASAVRANEEKTRFIAAAAHDLRQPLHALGLFAASAEQRLRDSREYPLIKNMTRATAALEHSFSAILDISRLDAGSVTPDTQAFPVRDLFRRMYLRFAGDAETRGLALRFSAAGKIIRSDPQLLERVIANLLQNALRYTSTGGVIVAARRSGDSSVRIEVRDSGMGIPENQLGLIFEEFYQVGNAERDRSQGLGMGLAIVRRICGLLGHQLDVKSKVGGGSVFSVTVPAESEGLPLELELGGETLPPREVRQLTLLVIDDEEVIRSAMYEFFSAMQQFRVLVAASIADAVKIAQQPGQQIDVIFSDLRLRGNETGIQAVRAVRNVVGVGTPAILMTGDTAPDRLREAHESGFLVLAKPVNHRQILKLIDRLPI